MKVRRPDMPLSAADTFIEHALLFWKDTLPAVLAATFGGLVHALNTPKAEWSWWWFFSGIITAGFVGMVVSCLLADVQMGNQMRVAIISISGYSANDILKVLKDKVTKKVGDTVV